LCFDQRANYPAVAVDVNLFGLMLLRQLRMQRSTSRFLIFRYTPPHFVIIYDEEPFDELPFDTDSDAEHQRTLKQRLH
jgi:hypothetical protein